MRATHRVKDGDNTVGFIVDGRYISYKSTKEHIDRLDNLSLQKNGTIKAKEGLPEIDYKEAVIIPRYKEIVEENPFQRDIQDEFKHWKDIEYKQIMQLVGPSQVGKTTELLKFAYKNYRYVIYVNMANDTFDFEDLMGNNNLWLGIHDYCSRTGLPEYKDTRETILIIDEIQNSKKVYNSLRWIRSELECDIAITGSYLCITYTRSGFFLPAGTITYIDMTPLKFQEFARVFEAEEILREISLFGKSEKEHYNKLNELYNLYKQIGGYPEVVKRYIQTKSINNCMKVIGDLLRVYKNESRCYFEQPREVEIFSSIYIEALDEMTKEKRGTEKNSVKIVTNTAKKNHGLIVNQKEIEHVIK